MSSLTVADDFPKAYDPASAEQHWYVQWMERRYFHADDATAPMSQEQLPEACMNAGMDPSDPKSKDKCAGFCSGPGADC